MNNLLLQQNLFQIIKSKLNKEANLAKVIAETLNVSIDAAYKKIKGERLIDMSELQVLLAEFKIPIADIDTVNTYNRVWFNFKPINGIDFTYKDYLKQMVNNLNWLINSNVNYIIYSAKEVPMFYNFMFPELGCFKSFVWQKSILNLPNFNTLQFDIYDLDNEIIELGSTIYELFNKIRSKEIWNFETVNCTLKQIEYYKLSGLFANEASLKMVTNQYKQLINHIELQTRKSKKINLISKQEEALFDLYHNELILGDNTVLIQFENSQMAFITPNAVSSFTSSHTEVTNYINANLRTVLDASTRMNKQNDKVITPFFEKIKLNLTI